MKIHPFIQTPLFCSSSQDTHLFKMLKTIFLLTLVALATCSVIGGFKDANVDDEDVVVAAKYAAKGLSKKFAGPYHHRLAKVLKAKKQVVAGVNYRLDVIVGKTNCKKDEVEYEHSSDCDFQDSVSTYKKCSVLVYRDLIGNHKLVSSGCVLASKSDL
ncbi:L-cystatin-like [Argiope bruennichi]|uniref:L-cystatin-like n=1 Tax=Argiope bruennichi TaxID=94029 RepID=UPI002494E764|nr:L-cystatin-like [Argiope bruennichi]